MLWTESLKEGAITLKSIHGEVVYFSWWQARPNPASGELMMSRRQTPGEAFISASSLFALWLYLIKRQYTANDTAK